MYEVNERGGAPLVLPAQSIFLKQFIVIHIRNDDKIGNLLYSIHVCCDKISLIIIRICSTFCMVDGLGGEALS